LPANHQRISTLDRRECVNRRQLDNPVYGGIEKRVADDRRKVNDNRKSPRLPATNSSFVRLYSVFKEDVGKLIDISKMGLSARNILTNGEPEDYSGLDIFLSDADFNIKKIPCTIVKNYKIPNEIPFSSIALNRCCIKFDRLTPDQESRLDFFLNKYTAGEA